MTPVPLTAPYPDLGNERSKHPFTALILPEPAVGADLFLGEPIARKTSKKLNHMEQRENRPKGALHFSR